MPLPNAFPPGWYPPDMYPLWYPFPWHRSPRFTPWGNNFSPMMGGGHGGYRGSRSSILDYCGCRWCFHWSQIPRIEDFLRALSVQEHAIFSKLAREYERIHKDFQRRKHHTHGAFQMARDCEELATWLELKAHYHGIPHLRDVLDLLKMMIHQLRSGNGNAGMWPGFGGQGFIPPFGHGHY